MNILVVYSHPVPESFNAAIRDAAVEALTRAGHTVRLLDLHAEGFDPVMGCDERRACFWVTSCCSPLPPPPVSCWRRRFR